MIDTEPLWEIATYELSERLGRRLTPELREKTVGGSLINTLTICAEHAGLQLADVDIAKERSLIYERVGSLMTDISPMPGVINLLETLPQPKYVTTNTERDLADRSIAAVGKHYFVGSVTGDEVAHPKPAPDMYLKAAQMAGADPQDCLVFEDSTNGMTGAVKAGCVVIALSDDPVPGATSLRELHGNLSLEGVTASDVTAWYSEIREKLR